MNNILLITLREYLTQVKKKSFILLTLLAPLSIVAFGVLVGFMLKMNESVAIIKVVDHSGIFRNSLQSNKKVIYNFIDAYSNVQVKQLLLSDKDIKGVLVIPKLVKNNYDQLEENTKLLVNDKLSYDTKQYVSTELKSVLRNEKIKSLGLTETQIKGIDKPFDLTIENIYPDEQADSDLAYSVKFGLSMTLMYSAFMFIIIYGVRVMRSVLEEKNNRVVEIIISSVKPFQLMMGKILGVTLVALTQFIIWIAMTVIAALFFNKGFSALKNNFSNSSSEQAANLDLNQYATEIAHMLLSLNFPVIIVVFIVFFLLGYIFYSSIYAAIGSAVDNETETGQFTLFAMMPLTLAVYGSFTIMKNPDGPLALWLSMIPLSSPIAMIARIPFGVPLWQILLSLAILIGTTLLIISLAAKIYRIGILFYGNKVTFKELYKWLRS